MATSERRPEGSSAEKGGNGRPSDSRLDEQINFREVNLPDEWYTFMK